MKSSTLEFEFDVFKETMKKYFNIEDKNKILNAFVFYYNAKDLGDYINDEDLKWARKTISNMKGI